MPNWKLLAEAKKASKYVLPAGWDSLEKVARNMECSEESARREWAPFVRSGEIEMQVFPVWDKLTKRLVRVTAYRQAPKAKPDAPADVRKRDKNGHFVKGS